MKQFGVNCLVFGLTLVILGVLLEGATRILLSPEKEIGKDWVRKFVQYNRDGFRDNSYVTTKPRDKFRILAVGDSYTFGHGIERLEDTFPKKLEKLLNQGMETPKFEVISFARPGWNTVDQLQYIYKKGFLYKPDLILLNFFHNDLPPSLFSVCDSKDWELFPKLGLFSLLFDHSSLYQFFKFRINRLLEKGGYKRSYEDCRRSSYQSKSWDMEEIYLDTIYYSTRMKNIHFMLSIIPVMFRLGDHYPFIFAHDKLKKYCDSRKIFCVDLYREEFFKKNEDDFIISRKDRHFNTMGSELVAQILFEKLKPLKNYQGLSRWHVAYDLKELLEINGTAGEFSLLFPELDVSPINLKNKKEETLAWSHQGNYYISRTNTNSPLSKKTSLRRIILERDGKIVKSEIKTFDPINGGLMRHEITDVSNGKIFQTMRISNQVDEKGFLEAKRSYVFKYHSKYRKDLDKFLWELEIEKNTRFVDPLDLESALFFSEKLYFDKPDIQKLKKSLEFYKTFHFYENGSGANYVKKLLEDILRVKPFEKSVQFVEELNKIKH